MDVNGCVLGGWAGPDQHFIPKSLISNYSGNSAQCSHEPSKSKVSLQTASEPSGPF